MTLKFAISVACALLESKVFVHPDYLEAAKLIRSYFPEGQAQDSTLDQLKRSVPLLNNAGLYDAADFVRTTVEAQERRIAGVDKSH